MKTSVIQSVCTVFFAVLLLPASGHASASSIDWTHSCRPLDAFGSSSQAKLVALAQEMLGLPTGPQLQQNAPNPFNSETVISWFLLEPGPVRLEVFALNGQRGYRSWPKGRNEPAATAFTGTAATTRADPWPAASTCTAW